MKSGFVAVAGRPNVGKSTLVNALVGGKVAIVSDKPQTTRRRIAGVVNGDGYQLVLVDLPGFQRPLDPMTERMQRTVDRAFEDVDAVLFVLSTRERIGAGDRFIAQRVFSLGVPVVIGLNKVDRLKPGHVATQMDTASKLGDFHALHPVSAKTGDGIAELREELVELLPEGPAYFPPEQRSDLSQEEEIGELIREKALALTREEVPHAISVEVEEVDEKVVRASLYVETDSQKQIVVGKGGSVVKEIGVRARPEIEHLVGHPVFLELQGQGQAEVAPRRGAARAPGNLMAIELVYETHSTTIDNETGIATGWLEGTLSERGRDAGGGARRAAARRRSRSRLHVGPGPCDRDCGDRVCRIGAPGSSRLEAPRVQLRRAERGTGRRDRRGRACAANRRALRGRRELPAGRRAHARAS